MKSNGTKANLASKRKDTNPPIAFELTPKVKRILINSKIYRFKITHH